MIIFKKNSTQRTIYARLLLAALVYTVLASSCLEQDDRSPYEHRLDFVENIAYPTEGFVDETYEVTGVTPGGVRYDSNGKSIDEAKLDLIVETVYGCLADALPDGKVSTQLADIAGCDRWVGILDIPDYTSFVVKIADVDDNGDPEWRMSCRSDQQLLNIEAPIEGCEAKGLDTKDRDDCTCSWRSVYRTTADGTHLFITTPSMYMLSDALTRMMTGCANPWATATNPYAHDETTVEQSDGIRACASPIVAPY